jgi:hypothetical protein
LEGLRSDADASRHGIEEQTNRVKSRPTTKSSNREVKTCRILRYPICQVKFEEPNKVKSEEPNKVKSEEPNKDKFALNIGIFFLMFQTAILFVVVGDRAAT